MIRFGLVGAGPWAELFHAPMLAAAPGVELAAVWARRPEAADTLAARYGAGRAASYDELLAGCDAVAFAVPPDVQAELAPRAAEAGRHLLLEKPLGFTLAEAERLAEAVERAGVVSLVMLRNRFDPAVRDFLAAAATVRPRAVVGRFVSDAALPGRDFATPWRVERGALLDLAPHALDLVETALGPVADLRAVGDPTRWVAVTTTHESGAVAQLSFSLTVPHGDGQLHLELVHEDGTIELGPIDEDLTRVQARIMAAFVDAVTSGTPVQPDVHRGLQLQRLLTP